MIREEFFPTSVFGKDIKLDNDKLAQDIVNWSNQDQGVSENKLQRMAFYNRHGIKARVSTFSQRSNDYV